MSILSIARPRRPLSVAVALALVAVNAQAITITVNDAGDSASPVQCTLRDAIGAVNAGAFVVAPPDPCQFTSSGTFGSNDTIIFAPALAGSTITLQQGQLAISAALAITGSGQTVDANAASRAFEVTANSTLTNLAVTNALVSGNGSAFYIHGASSPVVTLSHVSVTDNVNNTSSCSGSGAINAEIGTTINLTEVRVMANTSACQSAGIFLDGAAAVLTNSTVSGNTVACGSVYCGAGIYATGSNLRIVGSTVSGNTATAGTQDGYIAGGIYVWDSTVSIVNSTIADNHASGTLAVAGGIKEDHSSSYPTAGATLTNTTVSGNTAYSSGAGAPFVSGGALVGEYGTNTGAMVLSNSIIAGNSATGGAAPAADFATNAANAPTLTFTYSLLGSALNVSPYNDAGNHNAFTDAPGLGPLKNNGGKTQTMELLAGSLAIDAGSNALALDANSQPLQTDQTGFVRIYNSTVDIGAFEYPGDHIFGDGFE